MSEHIVNDLAEHVLARHTKNIHRALDLLDEDGDRFALMITLMGSELSSFVATLASANPTFAKLPTRMQFVAANFLLYRSLGLKIEAFPTAQEMSDLFAALQSYPEVRLA
jgi:hypothetical protein